MSNAQVPSNTPTPMTPTPMPPPPRPTAPVLRLDGSESIVVENVSKWFGDVVAVSDVSFEVRPGVTALLGPNGAGKSTMLRMISGLTSPGEGTIRLLGENPRTSRAVRRQVGLVPQQERLFDEQRALEFVALAARLHGLDNPESAAREALAAVEMNPEDVRPVASYSKGMTQRVKVAQAIVHRPQILMLDEPLTGLDPRQRLQMINLIRELGAAGHSVVVSSHVLDEVERLGSRVLVIAQGRLVAQGDFRAIRDLMDDRPHQIRLRVSDARRLGAALVADGAVVGLTVDSDEQLTVETTDVQLFRRTIAATTKETQVRLVEVKPLDDDLESVFRYLVGR